MTLNISSERLHIGNLIDFNPQSALKKPPLPFSLSLQGSGAGVRVMSTRNRQSGFTYLALLAAIVIIGISLGSAGKYWQNVMMREKEEELLFRGEQYRLAIERYFTSFPGRFQYPQSIDDLLKDSRSAAGKRHLRRKYKDPITGEDFEVIKDQTKGNRITGVYSKSEKEPLRTKGFEDPYKDFENKKKYNEWKFIFTQQGLPGQPLVMPPPQKPLIR